MQPFINIHWLQNQNHIENVVINSSETIGFLADKNWKQFIQVCVCARATEIQLTNSVHNTNNL